MDHDGDLLNSVVLPLMNVNRRTKRGDVNENEPHQAQLYITSAGVKNSYAYERMKELILLSIINPKQVFCWGCDYRVPVMYGLIPANYVQELKASGTFKEEAFAQEYLSSWSSLSAESWMDYDKIKNYRVTVNAELKKKDKINQKIGENPDQFYILSVDVGRLGCETVICVFKVLPQQSYFIKKLVNIEVLPERLHFEHQAARIKEMIQAYDPKEVVIDGNGLTN